MDSERRKPEADFVIRLVGSGMRPWRVPFRNLARVLNAVQRLVEQREEEDDADVVPSGEIAPAAALDAGTLRLIDVKDSSAAYRVAAPNPKAALRLIGETGQSIKEPSKANWTLATLSSLEELSEIARSLGCEIEFRLPGAGKGRQYGDVLATIRPSTFTEVQGTAFISGRTSVYATIERVGGATKAHCGIRIPEQLRKMVICRVDNDDLVRQLGQFIYQDVVLIGRGTWLRHSLHLRHFVIEAYEPPKTGSFRDALRRIYDAGGHAWDRVDDPDALLAEIRRG